MKLEGMEMLTAVWASHQDVSIEAPKEVYWASGRAATHADYRRHELDTHTILDELPVRIVKHMLPGIEAEVRFDCGKGVWMLRCFGYATIQLDLTDPFATNDQIYAEIYTLPTVFKVQIIRE